MPESMSKILLMLKDPAFHLKIAKIQLIAACPGVSGTRNTRSPVSNNRRMHSKAWRDVVESRQQENQRPNTELPIYSKKVCACRLWMQKTQQQRDAC